MWNRKTGRQPCDIVPDRVAPLWESKAPVIYYWSADEYDARSAYMVTSDSKGALERFVTDY